MAELEDLQPEGVESSEAEMIDEDEELVNETASLDESQALESGAEPSAEIESEEEDQVAMETGYDKDRSEVEAAMEKVLNGAVIAIEEDSTELQEVEEDLAEAQAEPEVSVEAEPEEPSAPVEEVDDGRRWYVVHCYSGYENKVRHNLEQRIETMGMKDRIFDVVVPTEEEIEVKEGKRRTIERRVFPGYILVQMIMTEESWYVVRNTPGVTGFVGMGNEPTPLRPEEVASIIKRMEAEAPRIKVTYSIGQKVRIIDGPFNDFIGTVDHIDMERAKVRVMVSFFGRETPVELDFLQVEKA
jgi:transcriptional antiterminator NusG